VREWLKANGGPPAIVIIGVGLYFGWHILGIAVVVIGAAMWLYSWQRFPFKIVRKQGAGSAAHYSEAATPSPRPTETTGDSWKELNAERVRRYEDNHGLFLIHDWRPSETEGQVADVVIRLWQHDKGPLTRGEVEAVEYTLGPKFSDHSRICTDPTNGYAIRESMWGPMLCLAKVYFSTGRAPLLLER
jgi:hypothetical protein